ncbi:trypsin-like peptidase domain-containing protein [Nakamurella sp. A5-74]|uniref:Trypsin-like peptidase domain-containing protein n=1 Tax=Nakamurella sp. A5-74 TaxID=3158264 RepID=A0AAU8DKG4_9ACTN
MQTSEPDQRRRAVDPAQAAVFGRPGQVHGSFAPPAMRPPGPAPRFQQRPVVPEMLADAFGRPDGAHQGLRRPPESEPAARTVGGPPSPWRDPSAEVRLGRPAEESPDEPDSLGGDRTAAPFTLRQALFDHRLRPSALIGLVVVTLLAGMVGGAVVLGLRSTDVVAGTDPDYTLAVVGQSIDRPVGSVAAIAAQVTPAVVSIEVRVGNAGGTGSGVVFDKAGYIVTNNHVISQAATAEGAELSVVFNDGKGTRVPATIVGRDPQTDLAVLQVSVDNPRLMQFGDSSKLAVGDPVIAIGSPLGLQGTVTTGIVSALDRPVRLSGSGSDTNAVIDAIQTDAAVNPGNSGGALVDGSGVLVGIPTAIRTLGQSEASGSIGLGFAIPADEVRQIVQEIVRTGSVQHADIGVNARSATDGTTLGAQVQNVRSGGPAAKAGIEEGDTIIVVGDRAVGNADELVVAVQEHAVGETVPVKLVRSGRSLTVQVTLTAG